MAVTVTIADHLRKGLCVHKQGCRDALGHHRWDVEVESRLDAAKDYYGIFEGLTDEQMVAAMRFMPCVQDVLPA